MNRDRVEPRWIHWQTKTRPFWDKCDGLSRGTSGKNRIKPELFLTIAIPLPAIEEQRRIVARIEALAAKIAEAHRLQQQSREEQAALAASALHNALPRTVSIKRLGEIIAQDSTISYGVLVPGPDVEGGIPFVRIQDLAVDDAPSKPAKSIAPEIDKQYARTRLNGGEVLIGVVGSIGKVGIAPACWAGANIARAVCRIVPNPEVDARYLASVLRGSDCQRYFFEATRTLAQPTLNVGQLEQTPIPPLAEQRRIVAYLDSLSAKAESSKSLRYQSAAELDALLPSILDRAFKGEL